VQRKAAAVHVAEPRLPRRRKMPPRYETGTATPHFPTTVEAHYRQIYFEVVDHAVSTIRTRFDQPSYAIYRQAEDLLIKSVHGEDASIEFSSVTDFYRDDFSDRQRLLLQLSSLATQFDGQKEIHLGEIATFLRSFSSAEREVFSEVMTLLKLILVNPATNAISERSFSAMRRLKTYLRSTMGQKRLNAVMLLHVHKETTDELSVIELVNTFANTEHRMSLFGTFSEKDL